MSDLMRAAVHSRGGAAQDVLEVRGVERPRPAPGEVRVSLRFSGINPTDVRARSDASELPEGQYFIPHQDGSGTVDAVGDGVDAGLIGCPVWVFHAAHQRHHGTAAEAVVLPLDRVVPLTSEDQLLLGATLGIPYLTAHLCAFEGRARRTGQDAGAVLVTGGAGAVGAAAVQLLRWAGGSTIIATASTEQKAAAAVEAGADHVIRYRDEDVAARLAEIAPDGLSRVIDVAPAENLASYVEALAPRSRVLIYAGGSTSPAVPVRPLMRKNASIGFIHVYGTPPERLRSAVEDVSQAVADRAVRPVATTVLPLERIVEAHHAVERGAFGRTLVELQTS